jgi:hypothetical protein
MTMSPGEPGPTDVEGRTLPPYEGRREAADIEGEERTHRDGAEVGGATGPAESDSRRAADPEDTPRGRVASPADETPAEEVPDGGSEEATVGPAHVPGTGRGEDVGKDDQPPVRDGLRNVGG